MFVIQTPDINSKESVEQKCGWGDLKPLEHLHLFTPGNFEKLAIDAGFSEVKISVAVEYGNGNFMAVMKK